MRHAITGWDDTEDGWIGCRQFLHGVRQIYSVMKLGRSGARLAEWHRARPRWHRGDRPRAGR